LIEDRKLFAILLVCSV